MAPDVGPLEVINAKVQVVAQGLEFPVPEDLFEYPR